MCPGIFLKASTLEVNNYSFNYYDVKQPLIKVCVVATIFEVDQSSY